MKRTTIARRLLVATGIVTALVLAVPLAGASGWSLAGWSEDGASEEQRASIAALRSFIAALMQRPFAIATAPEKQANERIHAAPQEPRPSPPSRAAGLAMYWDFTGSGNVTTGAADFRRAAAGAIALGRVDINVTSFQNGQVRVNFTPIATGAGTSATIPFDSAAVSAQQIFDPIGTYIFDQSAALRRRSVSAPIAPGRYAVSITPQLQAPAVGLAPTCRVQPSVIDVTDTTTPQISIRCGIPTTKLAASTLQAAKTSNTATVLDGPELFAVCLGNGGSDTIFGPPQSGGDITSQIGDGVDFVEDLLELNSLITSNGAGIDLNCASMGNVNFSGSVVDEPLWRYLVSLDIFRELDLSGDLEQITITDGAYGDDEIDSILAPYQNLIDTAEFPYGVLTNTPTRRLQKLNFSFNVFNTPAWSNLWRISASDAYTVGDTRSTNNFGIIYTFAVQRDASVQALSRLQAQGPAPMLHLSSPDTGVEEGFEGSIDLPLSETGGLSFGPFDIGNDPSSELIDVTVSNVPGDVVCSINGIPTENGVVTTVEGLNHTPYENKAPLLVSCDLRANTMRLAATIAFPREHGNQYPQFNGSVGVEVRTAAGSLVEERTLSLQSSDQVYFFELTGLADGDYRARFTPRTAQAGPSYGCQDGGELPFSVNGGNVELGIVQCSEVVSSLPNGLIRQCYQRAGIDLVHELGSYQPGGVLDCSGLSGATDFGLLEVPIAARALDLRNNNLNSAQIDTLTAFAFQLPASSALRRVLLSGNPGTASLDNTDFARLLNNFQQIDSGAVNLPLGSGLMAQCLRRNNFASADDALVFRTGDTLDCSNLSGTADFADMASFIRNPVFFDSAWNFQSTQFNATAVQALTSNLFRTYPRIDLRNNPAAQSLGNVTYLRLAADFSVIQLDGGASFPRFVYIKPADPQAGELFGRTAAISADGDVIAVAAPAKHIAGVADAGAVYVFVRERSGWRQAQRIVSEVLETRARLGDRLAVSADGRYIAAARNLLLGQSNVVDVYVRDGSSSWSLDASLSVGAGGNALYFFEAATDPRLFITDPAALVQGATSGAVDQYRRASGVWRFERRYQPVNEALDDGDRFGQSVALTDAGFSTPDWKVLIGAPGDDSSNPDQDITNFGTALDDNDDGDSGAVWVFNLDHQPGDRYGFIKDTSIQPLGSANAFGRSLGADSNRVIIGGQNQFVLLRDRVATPFSAASRDTFPGPNDFGDNYRVIAPNTSISVGETLLLRRSQEDGSELPPTLQLITTDNFSTPQFRFDFANEFTTDRIADQFGRFAFLLSADGETTLISAPLDDSGNGGVGADANDNGAVDSGAVYVYP